jgi:predicted branched-subunit amino acid permease
LPATIRHHRFSSAAFAFLIMLKDWNSPIYREGFRACAPSLFGMGAWGMVVGVAMIKAGLSLPQALGMTLLVFAGSAQLAALPLIVANAPIWVIFATALIVNLRFLIMSALIAPRFAHLPWLRRTLLGFLTGDLTVALFMQRFPTMWQTPAEERDQVLYLHGLVVPNWIVWQLGSILGILAGSQVPTHWGLGFAGTLAILCILLPLMRNRPGFIGVVVAGAVAVAAHDLPYKLGLLLAVLIGMAVSMWIEEHMELAAAPEASASVTSEQEKRDE